MNAVTELGTRLTARLTAMDTRLTTMDARLTTMDAHIGAIPDAILKQGKIVSENSRRALLTANWMESDRLVGKADSKSSVLLLKSTPGHPVGHPFANEFQGLPCSL